MDFIQARNYTRVTSPARTIDVIVLHTMEYPELPTGAEWCANYFAAPTAPKASCHYAVDNDTVVQCVRDEDVAWAAPGCNHNGLQLEHAGYAASSAAGWDDEYSRAMLQLSAKLSAKLCNRHALPVRFVDADGLRAGRRGITTHAEVTKAFPGPGRTHWDPGPNFPMAEYIERVKAFTAPAPQEEDDVSELTQLWIYWRLVLKADPAKKPAVLEGFSPTDRDWELADWIHNVVAFYGPHSRYQDWRDWRILQDGDRPATAPQSIPPRWWDAAERDHAFAKAWAAR